MQTNFVRDGGVAGGYKETCLWEVCITMAALTVISCRRLSRTAEFRIGGVNGNCRSYDLMRDPSRNGTVRSGTSGLIRPILIVLFAYVIPGLDHLEIG